MSPIRAGFFALLGIAIQFAVYGGVSGDGCCPKEALCPTPQCCPDADVKAIKDCCKAHEDCMLSSYCPKDCLTIKSCDCEKKFCDCLTNLKTCCANATRDAYFTCQTQCYTLDTTGCEPVCKLMLTSH